MYDPQRYYKNRSYYTKKGLSIQKRPQNPPKIIDKFQVPIYRNYFLESKQLMPYTPGISYIEFKKRSSVDVNIGEFILDEVLAYGKNLTDITKIEIDPELDVTLQGTSIITVSALYESSGIPNTVSPYGINSIVTISNSSNLTSTNNAKYTFEVTEGGWNVRISPGVNKITSTYINASAVQANINNENELIDTRNSLSTRFPVEIEYKGKTVGHENVFLLYLISYVSNSINYIYTNIQVKVYF